MRGFLYSILRKKSDGSVKIMHDPFHRRYPIWPTEKFPEDFSDKTSTSVTTAFSLQHPSEEDYKKFAETFPTVMEEISKPHLIFKSHTYQKELSFFASSSANAIQSTKALENESATRKLPVSHTAPISTAVSSDSIDITTSTNSEPITEGAIVRLEESIMDDQRSKLGIEKELGIQKSSESLIGDLEKQLLQKRLHKNQERYEQNRQQQMQLNERMRKLLGEQELHRAETLFYELRARRLRPSRRLFCLLLYCFGRMHSAPRLHSLLQYIIQSHITLDEHLANALLFALSELRDLPRICTLLEQMQSAGLVPNASTLHLATRGLVKSGADFDTLFSIYREIARDHGVRIVLPGFLVLLRYAIHRVDPNALQWFLQDIISQLSLLPPPTNDDKMMLAEVRTLNIALRVLRDRKDRAGMQTLLSWMIAHGRTPSERTFRLLFSAAVQDKNLVDMVTLLDTMRTHGVSLSEFACRTVLWTLAKRGFLSEMLSIFDRFVIHGVVLTSNVIETIITALVYRDNLDGLLRFLACLECHQQQDQKSASLVGTLSTRSYCEMLSLCAKHGATTAMLDLLWKMKRDKVSIDESIVNVFLNTFNDPKDIDKMIKLYRSAGKIWKGFDKLLLSYASEKCS